MVSQREESNMIQWKRENIHKLVSLFGDGLEHPWPEVINIGTRYFLNSPINTKRHKTHQAKFEEFLKKGVNYGIIDKIDTPYTISERQKDRYLIETEDFNYKLSKKGDRLLRQEQAERTGDSFFFSLYDRGVHTPFGVDKFAPLPSSLKKIKEN